MFVSSLSEVGASDQAPSAATVAIFFPFGNVFSCTSVLSQVNSNISPGAKTDPVYKAFVAVALL